MDENPAALDAFALMGFLRDEPAARVEDVLRSAIRGQRRVLMSIVNFG